MKIKNIKFNKHKILGNLEVDFLDRNKEILGTVVIIGENGSGKTTLLKSCSIFFDATRPVDF